MDQRDTGLIRAGTVEDIASKGMVVVSGRHCPILVVHHDGEFHALDNRCPHLGFPLERGSVDDGILTCHWHHARFDLKSGCTLDPWADDIPAAPVEIRDGAVWVSAALGTPRGAEAWREKLQGAMARDLGLVTAKATIGALSAGIAPEALVRDAVLFGLRNRDGWHAGTNMLTALASVLDALAPEDRPLALYHGIKRVAEDCADAAPAPPNMAMASPALDPATLTRWLRRWSQVRHRSAAERTILTAIENGGTPTALTEMLLSADTDRAYGFTGHTLDFIVKAAECLDRIGWDHAGEVLPALAGDLVAAKGGEERNEWRHPVDLIALLTDCFAHLPARLEQIRNGPGWHGHAALAEQLLGDDPAAILAALDHALDDGAGAADLGRALALAAALRLARFGTANEFSDWNSAHHAFIFAHGVHMALRRIARPNSDDGGGAAWEPVRAVYHGAMALYLIRFLNIPPARIADGSAPIDGVEDSAAGLCQALLQAFDRQQQIDLAGRIVARYCARGFAPDRLIATLGHGLLRENPKFHAIQSFEAALCEFTLWDGAEAAPVFLIACARFLAAHSPSDRARLQTFTTARKLHRGGKLYEGTD